MKVFERYFRYHSLSTRVPSLNPFCDRTVRDEGLRKRDFVKYDADGEQTVESTQHLYQSYFVCYGCPRAQPDLGNHLIFLNHYNCRIIEGMTVKKIFVYEFLPSSTTSSWVVKLEELHPCNITRTACSPDAFIVPAAVPRYLYRLPKSP